MGLNLIIAENLDNVDIACQIAQRTLDKRYLHLCATGGLKEIRCGNGELSSSQISFTPRCKTFNTATYAEFIRFLQTRVPDNKKLVNVSDERFILRNIIDLFFEDESKKNVFFQMRFQLFELYQFLLFHDVSIERKTIKKISADFSEFESDVFSLYVLFANSINAITTRNPDTEIMRYISNIDFTTGAYITSHNHIKRVLKQFIESCDVIVLDGFMFFNDVQKHLIQYALELGKEVYLTAKYSERQSYLLDIVYPALFHSLGVEYNRPVTPNKNEAPKTALDFVKRFYGDFSDPKPTELLNDKSIQFVKPFPNRESEWKFIANQISCLLRRNCGTDTVKLRTMLTEEIAVVLALRSYEYNEQLSAALKDTGLFIYTYEKQLNGKSGRVSKSFGDVYFRREDFINERICFEDGTELTYVEKSRLFDKAFKGITIKRGRTPLIAYPVGQYVFKIYDILLNGISTNTFKILLYSNWQYHAQVGAIRWDKYLSDFKTIEVFFEKKTGVDEWLSVFEELLKLKDDVDNDYLLKHHPVRVIDRESLLFFQGILLLIKDLVHRVGSVNGPISEHLNVLKNAVMKIDKLILLEDEQFERSIVLELIEAVDNIQTSSLIRNVPATYFAENLHAMLSDFETEAEEADDPNEMYLNLITLENVKHFKHCFFPLFEATKYPRKYFESFPFNRETIEILSNPKYGINRVPSDYKDITSHIVLEENLFKNVIDFTEEKLVITMTQKEDEHKNHISYYAHDIASLFDSEIIWTEPDNELKNDEILFAGRKPPTLQLPEKKRYTLKELVTYKLCPRLYYHDEVTSSAFCSKFQLQFYFIAVMFSAALNEFKTYNLKNKKTYRTGNKEALETIKPMFEDVYKRYLPLFDIFTNYELSDIRAVVHRKIENLFTDLEGKGIKGSVFTIVGVPENPVHIGNDYELILEYDTKIYDMQNRVNRISQNDIYIDFLVLKTQDNEKDPLKHYADMVDALDKNAFNCDRVNLVFKMMGKINIQFDSKRYAQDGIVRTNALVEEIRRTDFSYLKPYPSKFCQYCRINDICKERAVLK